MSGPALTGLRAVSGSLVTIATPDGWTGTLMNSPTTTLNRGTMEARVLLDPAYAADVMKRHAAEVGASDGSATLTVVPQVTLGGAVQGHPFAAASPAGISLSLTPTTLRPSASGTAAFNPSVSTPVKTTVVVPRRFQLLSVSLPLALARILAGVVLALAVVVLAVAGWIGRKRPGNVADDILLRSAARILPVTGFTPGTSVVDVSDAESLRRVAERLDTLVLHLDGEDGHTFAVQDIDTTYRFVLPTSTKPRPPRPPAPVTRPLPRVPATVLSVVRDDPAHAADPHADPDTEADAGTEAPRTILEAGRARPTRAAHPAVPRSLPLTERGRRRRSRRHVRMTAPRPPGGPTP